MVNFQFVRVNELRRCVTPSVRESVHFGAHSCDACLRMGIPKSGKGLRPNLSFVCGSKKGQKRKQYANIRPQGAAARIVIYTYYDKGTLLGCFRASFCSFGTAGMRARSCRCVQRNRGRDHFEKIGPACPSLWTSIYMHWTPTHSPSTRSLQFCKNPRKSAVAVESYSGFESSLPDHFCDLLLSSRFKIVLGCAPSHSYQSQAAPGLRALMRKPDASERIPNARHAFSNMDTATKAGRKNAK